MSRSHLFVFAMLTALAIAWLVRSGYDTKEAPATEVVRDDFVMDNFALKVFDNKGALTHRSFGKTLRQLGGSHSLELEAPRLDIPTVSGSWEIRAREGWMDATMTRAALRGAIVAIGRLNDEVVFNTSDLNIDLVTRVATTDALVSISQGNNRLRGEALTANLQQHELLLRNNIEGYYVP